MLVDYTVIDPKSQSFLCKTPFFLNPALHCANYFKNGGYLLAPAVFNVSLFCIKRFAYRL